MPRQRPGTGPAWFRRECTTDIPGDPQLESPETQVKVPKWALIPKNSGELRAKAEVLTSDLQVFTLCMYCLALDWSMTPTGSPILSGGRHTPATHYWSWIFVQYYFAIAMSGMEP